MIITIELMNASLKSPICPSCGRRKARQHRFCRECFLNVPYVVRQQIENAVAEIPKIKGMGKALESLNVNEPYWPNLGK